MLEAARLAVEGGSDLLLADGTWCQIIAHLNGTGWSKQAVASAVAHFARFNDFGYPSIQTTAAALAADEAWFARAFDAKRANDFGLRMLGFHPEVCADVYAPDHRKAPSGGTPRQGAGPRTARGGAGMVFPWQGCGEWHLLLNAFRASADIWEFHLSHRPALGLTL